MQSKKTAASDRCIPATQVNTVLFFFLTPSSRGGKKKKKTTSLPQKSAQNFRLSQQSPLETFYLPSTNSTLFLVCPTNSARRLISSSTRSTHNLLPTESTPGWTQNALHESETRGIRPSLGAGSTTQSTPCSACVPCSVYRVYSWACAQATLVLSKHRLHSPITPCVPQV